MLNNTDEFLLSEFERDDAIKVAAAVDDINVKEMRRSLWVLRCYCKVTSCSFCEFQDICEYSWDNEASYPSDWEVFSPESDD